MGAGAHSAAYIGTVALFGPIPSPRTNLAIYIRGQFRALEGEKGKLTNRCGHELVTPCQKQVRAVRVAVMKMAPRLPNQVLRGSVNQHPKTAQQSCNERIHVSHLIVLE
jgi:hypothetical protein